MLHPRDEFVQFMKWSSFCPLRKMMIIHHQVVVQFIEWANICPSHEWDLNKQKCY